MLGWKHDGIVLNAHYEGDGRVISRHACKLDCEGIVSKRLGSPHRSGWSDDWLKIKNPEAPAYSSRPRRIGTADASLGRARPTAGRQSRPQLQQLKQPD